MTKKRNGAIDFWRFVFAVVLVIFHSHLLNVNGAYKGIDFPLHNGSLAVEFFLIVSGYLFAASVNKEPEHERICWENTWGFTKHKLMGFFPAFVICWVVAFIAQSVILYDGLRRFIISVFRAPYELLLLRNAGFEVKRLMPQAWYLSALVIILFILYPIYAASHRRFEYYIAPIAAALLLGYLFFDGQSLLDPTEHLALTFRGNIRAAGEICLGVVCYVLCGKMRQREFTRFGAHLLSLIELFGYIVSILYMQFYHRFDLPSHCQFYILFIMTVSVTVTFSEKSSINPLFDHGVFRLLGRYSLYPYLISSLFSSVLPVLFPEMGMRQLIGLYLGLTFVSAAVIMALQKPIVRLFGLSKRLVIKPKN